MDQNQQTSNVDYQSIPSLSTSHYPIYHPDPSLYDYAPITPTVAALQSQDHTPAEGHTESQLHDGSHVDAADFGLHGVSHTNILGSDYRIEVFEFFLHLDSRIRMTFTLFENDSTATTNNMKLHYAFVVLQAFEGIRIAGMRPDVSIHSDGSLNLKWI